MVQMTNPAAAMVVWASISGSGSGGVGVQETGVRTADGITVESGSRSEALSSIIIGRRSCVS